MNQYRLGLLAALTLTSGLALAAESGSAADRQGRMNDAYTNYRNTQPGGVDRSGTSVRREGRHAGHAVGNAARRTGHAMANGARKAGHAVGTGMRKTGEAIDRGGEKLQEKSAAKP